MFGCNLPSCANISALQSCSELPSYQCPISITSAFSGVADFLELQIRRWPRGEVSSEGRRQTPI